MGKTMMILIALAIGTHAQARIWTNTAGKKLEADLVRVSGDSVLLKVQRLDKTYSFKIADLSTEDQDFIEQYNNAIDERLKKQALMERTLIWHDNLRDATAEAEKLGMPILLLYTAPSWCSYCRMLEEEVLNNQTFRDFARENLVLLESDFSDKEEGETWLERHPSLKKSCPIKGYPSMYILSASAEKRGFLGNYEDKWSIQDYIDKINTLKIPPPKKEEPKTVRKEKQPEMDPATQSILFGR